MEIARMIDHTYLKPFGTKQEIDRLLEEAIEHEFKSVCVHPLWVSYCAESLKKTDVLVCTVVGFPLGASTTSTKVFETRDALKNGAHEVDMVQNIAWAKEGQFDLIEKEVRAIKEECERRTLKVILETCYLTDEEIRLATEAAVKGGADFVKTSTGFGTGGAEVGHVRIMKEAAGDKEVKASGGVKTREDFENMVEAGATRIGTSSGVQLVKGETSKEDY